MTVICVILLCALVISLYALWRTYVFIENAEAKVAEYRRIAEAAVRVAEEHKRLSDAAAHAVEEAEKCVTVAVEAVKSHKRAYVEPKMEVIEE